MTEQQVAGVCDVQRWSREREEALDQELQATYRSLSDTVCSDALLSPYPDMAAYMAHMSLAIANLSSLEAFVGQVSLATHAPNSPSPEIRGVSLNWYQIRRKVSMTWQV
jgi:hypothetical protein